MQGSMCFSIWALVSKADEMKASMWTMSTPETLIFIAAVVVAVAVLA
jgi:hypothetical protein